MTAMPPIDLATIHGTRRPYRAMDISGNPFAVWSHWEESVLAAVQAWTEPKALPTTLEQFKALLNDIALIGAVGVGEQQYDIDAAYLSVAEWLDYGIASKFYGVIDRAALFADCTATIDRAIPALKRRIPEIRDEQFWRLKKIGLTQITAGAPSHETKMAMAVEASKFKPSPPESLLFEAFNDAVMTARSNTKWLTNRDRQTA